MGYCCAWLVVGLVARLVTEDGGKVLAWLVGRRGGLGAHNAHGGQGAGGVACTRQVLGIGLQFAERHTQFWQNTWKGRLGRRWVGFRQESIDAVVAGFGCWVCGRIGGGVGGRLQQQDRWSPFLAGLVVSLVADGGVGDGLSGRAGWQDLVWGVVSGSKIVLEVGLVAPRRRKHPNTCRNVPKH